MSLTTPSRNTILSSLRSRRTVVWICGAVAVIGIVVLFGTFGRGGPGRHVSRRPSDKSLEVPASPAARSVARRFLETAVGRQDLATAYTLVGPWLKGVPRKQWIEGHNPVTYFPASNLKTAPLNVLSSTKKALMLEVGAARCSQGNPCPAAAQVARVPAGGRSHPRKVARELLHAEARDHTLAPAWNPARPAAESRALRPVQLTENSYLTAENVWYGSYPVSSTTSSPNTFLSSPRSQRMMMWIGGAVLVVGVIVFLGVFFGRGSSQDVHGGNVSSIDQAAKVNPLTGEIDNKKVPASPAARNVARTFLMTAVARKHLDVAWRITGPWLKGESRKEWLTGNNPVTPFRDATNLKTAPFKVLSSTKNALLLDVGPLVPAKITKTHTPLSFKLEVDRMHGKWLVNYFVADIPMQRLATPGAGLGGN